MHKNEGKSTKISLNLSPTTQPMFLMLGIFSSFGDLKKKLMWNFLFKNGQKLKTITLFLHNVQASNEDIQIF